MTKYSLVFSGLAVWAMAFATPAVSHADVMLFSNLGAGSSYDTVTANVVGNAFDGANYAQGATFVSSATTTLSAVRIALSCAFGACSNSVVVSLDSNNAGQPGGVLESFTVAGGSLAALGSNNPLVVLNSIVHPNLTLGTRYWVTVRNSGADSVAWNLNNTGDPADEAISDDGAATWFSPSGLTPGAFQVNGATPAVPEPSAIILLGTLVAGIVLKRATPGFHQS